MKNCNDTGRYHGTKDPVKLSFMEKQGYMKSKVYRFNWKMFNRNKYYKV